MCDPITAATTIAVAGATAGVLGKDKQARQGQNAAKEGLIDYAAQTADQQNEISAENSQQKSLRARKAEQELSTLTAALGDSGLSGNTQDRLVNDAAGSASEDLANIDANRSSKIQQTVQGVSQARAKAANDIRANPRQSIFGAGLQIVGSGMNAYSGAGGKFG